MLRSFREDLRENDWGFFMLTSGGCGKGSCPESAVSALREEAGVKAWS